MGFFLDLNDWFYNHQTVFAVVLGSVMFLPNIFFTCSLVHALRGNRHQFPILMSVAGILATSFYMVHAFFEDSYYVLQSTFFYLAFVTIAI